ncbi:hypothetical protein AURDEDRAFT_35511, partial [Auricularia subglabra TFB-10046 SS5]
LRWTNIPWPMMRPSRDTESLTYACVATFILSPRHSQGISSTDRVRTALQRWHPEHFEVNWLPKCADREQGKIRDGVGLVVQHLTEVLSLQDGD